MSAIQVKNVPPELHDELRRRAAEEGKTVGEIILEAIRRDLRRQTTREWLDRVRELTKDFPNVSREEFDEIISESERELWGRGPWADDDDRR